jgi:hypothetical protein
VAHIDIPVIGGAYDNKVFGFTGRPANDASSLASVADIDSFGCDVFMQSFQGWSFHVAAGEAAVVIAGMD